MKNSISIAVAQMCSVDVVDSNLSKILELIRQAFDLGTPRLICFPENCLYLRVVEGEAVEGFDLGHPLFRVLENEAVKRNCYLHLGSVGMKRNDKLFNASVLITPEGNSKITYEKIHLFDIDLEGHKPLRESDVFAHGENSSIFEIDGFQFGQSICYDLRFSELYSQYARRGVDAILVPAAFLVKTGQAHWEVLLRARAIESQCYVIAAAQSGTHKGRNEATRKSYGHSAVVNPWGEVELIQDGDSEGVQLVNLHKESISKVRRQIPMASHRRL